MFLQKFLHRRHVQHLIGDDPLQLGVLGLQRREGVYAPRSASKPPYFLRQAVERRRTDAVTSANVVHLGARLVLLQNAYDLFFC